MKSQAIRADLLMLLAAAIWGFAFVAQREGMETMGPFLFNTARFFIGTVFLFPIVWYLSKKNKPQENKETSTKTLVRRLYCWIIFIYGFEFSASWNPIHHCWKSRLYNWPLHLFCSNNCHIFWSENWLWYLAGRLHCRHRALSAEH